MNIKKGHFNKTRLDGLKFAITVDFPGALHEGNGKIQPIIDERASPEQREALFAILQGKNSAEGTIFHIFSLIVSKVHDPVFAPIRWSFDKAARKARLEIPGVLETDVEPIKNPVTGEPEEIRVEHGTGFIFKGADVVAAKVGWVKTPLLNFDWPNKAGFVAKVKVMDVLPGV